MGGDRSSIKFCLPAGQTRDARTRESMVADRTPAGPPIPSNAEASLPAASAECIRRIRLAKYRTRRRRATYQSPETTSPPAREANARRDEGTAKRTEGKSAKGRVKLTRMKG